jgi:hypothetical protein
MQVMCGCNPTPLNIWNLCHASSVTYVTWPSLQKSSSWAFSKTLRSFAKGIVVRLLTEF